MGYRDSHKQRAHRWQNGKRRGYKRVCIFTDKYCLECNKVFTPNSATQLRHGPYADKASCAYKGMLKYWRAREKKRKSYRTEKIKKYMAKYRITHKAYYKNYGIVYRQKMSNLPK